MKLKSLVAAAAIVLLLPLAAGATPILTIVPSAGSVAVGGSFTADVVISGLQSVIPNQIVSGYHLDMLYNSGLLSQTGFATDQSGAVMGFSFYDTLGTAAGNAWATDYSTETDAFLLGLQGNGFSLFRVTFQGLANGAAFLSFGSNSNPVASLTDQAGVTHPLVFQAVGACVAVGTGSCGTNPPPVPEPASLLLLGTGLAALVARRRRSNSGA